MFFPFYSLNVNTVTIQPFTRVSPLTDTKELEDFYFTNHTPLLDSIYIIIEHYTKLNLSYSGRRRKLSKSQM